jgi:hypothetical protein
MRWRRENGPSLYLVTKCEVEMQNDLLNQAHIKESIAGEEDPGAALDVVRALVGRNPERVTSSEGANAKINFSCSDVVWPRHHAKEDVAKLLGLVMAHHGAIADTAWSLFAATGKSPMELEVDEGQDGVFYINRRDA